MRGIVLTLCLCASLAVAQAKPRGSPYERVEKPSKEQVEAAVDALNAAFKKKKDATAQIDAIQTYGGYEDASVVRGVAKGVRSRNDDVKLEAIRALGWLKHKEALKQLHRLYRREKKTIYKNETLYAALFKAIGRHGEKSSLEVLGDSPFKGITPAVAKARILGIANVRHKDAVKALMKGMRLTGDSARGGRLTRASEPRAMENFRTALCVLTGEDFGGVSEDWQRWWRKNKNKFRMSPTRPQVKPEIQRQWETFWDEPY